MVGELVEVTGREGKGKSWDGGTAKLLAIHEDTMDVKYIIGGKGTKIPNIFIRRFGTDPIEISMEDMEKACGNTVSEEESKKAQELALELSHGVVVGMEGRMFQAMSQVEEEGVLKKKKKKGRASKTTSKTASKTASKMKGKKTKGMKGDQEEIKFVVRCWTGYVDPDPRPDIYFGGQRTSLLPLKEVDESDKALKQQQQEINDSQHQKPVTAHSWRHADRPPPTSGVDVQVRVDNTLSKMYLPLDLNIDQSPGGGLPQISLEVNSSKVGVVLVGCWCWLLVGVLSVPLFVLSILSNFFVLFIGAYSKNPTIVSFSPFR
jgi:hypothetical protein